MNRNLLRILLSIALTVALTVFLLSRIDVSEIPRLIRQADLGLLATFLALSTIGLVVRTERYRVLLDYRVRFLPLVLVTAVRNFLTDLLPARTGSLSYVVLLTRRLHVPVEPVLSSFVLAFLYDLIAMATLLAIAVTLEFGRFEGASILAVMVGFLAVGSVSAVVLITPSVRLAVRLSSGRRVLDRAVPFLRKVEQELEETASLARRTWILSLSVVIRLLKFGAYWALLLAILHQRGYSSEDLPFWRVFLGIAGAELSATLPVHGIAGFGTYEAAWTLGFSYLGLDEETAILSGFATHLLSQVHDYTLGLLALAILLAWNRWREPTLRTRDLR